jgi:hypothetical protein
VSFAIRYYPPCVHHVFLSHSREDHDALVRPVYDRLVATGVTPWIDRHHYAYGRNSRAALQSAILECRHVAFFVTPAMLASGRGWCPLELGYTEILQHNLMAPGGPLTNLFLPLYFLPQTDPLLPRTVWQAVRDRGRFHDAGSTDRVTWAADEIVRFFRREQKQAVQLQKQAKRDSKIRSLLPIANGIRQRVTLFEPPLPDASSAESPG